MNLSRKQTHINSSWTAVSAVQGWKHFRICTRRKNRGGLDIEMMAVCDRKVRFWLSVTELKNTSQWRSGWQ